MRLRKLLITNVFLFSTLLCLSQTGDSSKTFQHFSGTASITNNGVSLVPSFSLGKPAVLVLASLGGERFSIDPDIRFGLNGKPWTFLFWARYKILPKGRFRLHTGTHLGLNFRTTDMMVDGRPTETTVARRYLAAELSPSYFISNTISVGTYYLYARGLDAGTIKNGHFLTVNAQFSHLPLAKNYYLRFNPQVFFLAQESKKGYYATSLISFVRNNFPVSVSYLINKKLKGNTAGKDLINSFSLVYSFNRQYVHRQMAL